MKYGNPDYKPFPVLAITDHILREQAVRHPFGSKKAEINCPIR
jgi:hypothetical protein